MWNQNLENSSVKIGNTLNQVKVVDVDEIERKKEAEAKKAGRTYRPAEGITAYNTQLVNFINEIRLDIIQGIKTVIEPNKIIEAEGSYIQGMILMDPDFGHSRDYCKYFMIQKSDQGSVFL